MSICVKNNMQKSEASPHQPKGGYLRVCQAESIHDANLSIRLGSPVTLAGSPSRKTMPESD